MRPRADLALLLRGACLGLFIFSPKASAALFLLPAGDPLKQVALHDQDRATKPRRLVGLEFSVLDLPLKGQDAALCDARSFLQREEGRDGSYFRFVCLHYVSVSMSTIAPRLRRFEQRSFQLVFIAVTNDI